jgi:mycothiol synthase
MSVPAPHTLDAFTIRPYSPGDEEGLVRTWNAALTVDPISTMTWRVKVLLDANFLPEACLVAEVDGVVRGFMLSITRQVPFFTDGLQPDLAWITAFGVAPEHQRRGIGSALLTATVDRLRGLGVKTVSFATYVPNYFTPGIDVGAYGAAVEFLTRRGFVVTSRPLSMRSELTGFRVPEPIAETARRLSAEGYEVRPVEPADIVPLLAFIRRHFSQDWYRETSGKLADLYGADPRQTGVVVALRRGEVVGYAEHRMERFGPFGVDPELRGQGIGRVLLAVMLSEMLKKGFHVAWFMSTSDDAARLYARCGFHETRRYAALRMSL